MIRIGFALAALTAAILVPLGTSGWSGEPGTAGSIQVAAVTPPLRSADAIALEACLGQKGARQAAKCVGHLAESCLKAPGADAECYRREAEAWSGLLDEYRGKIEKRLATDPKRLADLRDGQRAWAADRARRCDLPAPGDAAACTMRESGRRVIELRLIADEARVRL